jgi:hypothetical protein
MPITSYKSSFINECGLTDMNMPPSSKVRRGLVTGYSFFFSTNLFPHIPCCPPPSSVSACQCLGRTYRYYTGEPLWPFGFGLSYVDFNLTCSATGTAVRHFGALDAFSSCHSVHTTLFTLFAGVQTTSPAKR